MGGDSATRDSLDVGMQKLENANLTKKVQTVLGVIDGEELGVTLPHEHLMTDLTCIFTEPENETERKLAHEKVGMLALSWLRYHPFQNLDNIRLLDLEEANKEAELFKQIGGRSIVDCTVIGMGRNAQNLARISRRTGLYIIMGSGYYTAPCHPPKIAEKSEEEITAEIVSDLTDGVNGSGIKSGFIGEIGCSWPLEDNERKLLSAAAQAQLQTGACLSIHPGRNPQAPFEIIDMIRDSGVDLRRVIMCHIDVRLRESNDRLRLAETGCCLEYDTFGWEGHFPSDWTTEDYIDIPNDTQRIYELQELIEKGFLDQILISHDICRKTARAGYGGWGYSHILKYGIPMMRQRGFTQEQLDAILVENPREMFSYQ